MTGRASFKALEGSGLMGRPGTLLAPRRQLVHLGPHSLLPILGGSPVLRYLVHCPKDGRPNHNAVSQIGYVSHHLRGGDPKPNREGKVGLAPNSANVVLEIGRESSHASPVTPVTDTQ